MPPGARVDAILSQDTSREAEERQVEIWRSLSTIQLAELIAGASRLVRMLALAGLRERHPSASEHELIARLAAMTYGRDLARKAYPELDDYPS